MRFGGPEANGTGERLLCSSTESSRMLWRTSTLVKDWLQAAWKLRAKHVANVAETQMGNKWLTVQEAVSTELSPDSSGSIGKKRGVLDLNAWSRAPMVNTRDSFSLALCRGQLIIISNVPCFCISCKALTKLSQIQAPSTRSPNLSTQAVGTIFPSSQSSLPFVTPVSTHNVPPKPPSIPN